MSDINIVMYHYVRNLSESRYPQIKGLDYKLFKEQVLWLKKNYNIIKVEDVMAAYEDGIELPPKAALLTFDDGYIDNYTYCFPILDEYNIQGVFYIPGKTFREHVLLDVNKIHFILASTDIDSLIVDVMKEIDKGRKEYELESNDELFRKYAVANRWDTKETIFVKRILQTVLPEELRNKISSTLFEKYVGISEDKFAQELYMNEEQIKCMKNNGMYIGLHGYDHYWLAQLSLQQMREDIDKSLEAMKGIIDEDRWVFNYPYGSYNNDIINYIEKKGCKLSMTTEARIADVEKDNRYLLPRLDANDYPPKSNNYLNYREVV